MRVRQWIERFISAGGQVMDYRALVATIDPDRPVYGLQHEFFLTGHPNT
jgi:thioesterase domain-containing protein